MASGNLAAAAAFFAAMGERAEHARHAAAERGAKLVEAKAKAALGTYDFGWPELAEATQENRVRLGFSANEPELMSGKLRDSIRHAVEGHRAVVGPRADFHIARQCHSKHPIKRCCVYYSWWKMPRFFFDVHDREGFHHDEVGSEFSSFDDARREVQHLLPDMAHDESLNGELHVIACDVRDETGRTVYRGCLTYEGTRDPA